ncbi:Os02g0225300 [Oryza sativa Japonica Group]|uniref:Os02g0225300 protein n=1 Tax=Oryza sativa subsp. japonica TaxID=39947 RepID=A0A0P0VGM9_ORYSJ|nr:Os02g0225300 [Oryza sativa Japonica Group]
MASGLVVAATDPLRAFLASAAASHDLPADLRDLASSLAARSAVPYRSLRDIWCAASSTAPTSCSPAPSHATRAMS